MYQTFDAFEYVDYLRRRWRVIAAASGVAVLLSLGISLLLPKHYTATASIVIEPPGGNDVRLSTAVSPVYLESLKTYERFASSDTLFARAAERFHLLGTGQSIESLKRQVLKVAKLRDTKILEISATLADPKTAQGLVQYLADETVTASRVESLVSDTDFVGKAQKQTNEAHLRLERTQKESSDSAVNAPIEALQSEVDAAVELQGKVQQQLVSADADVAEYQQQAQTGGQFAGEQLQAARARASLLQKRSDDLARDIKEKGKLLATRLARREQLQTETKLAQSAYEALSNRLRDLEVTAGSHAEQLRVIDPGIVPQRPSSPNIALNVAIALFLALAASIAYLSLAFAYRRNSPAFEPAISRGMRG
ncbi:MAG TPA: GNVR domain-containing protein [Bryobacteraceae bacterium]|nr:GNVR domain-containing protein [Bryobacteraceae bacterium]